MEIFFRLKEKPDDLPHLVQGLQYFLKKVVRKTDLLDKKDSATVKWGCRVAESALIALGSTSTAVVG